MGMKFFEMVLGGKKQKPVERAGRERQAPSDCIGEFVAEWGYRRHFSRRELEESVARMQVGSLEGAKFCFRAGERKVVANNPMLEASMRQWEPGVDAFGMVPARGFEVVRILKGKIALTEHSVFRHRMEAYCVAELNAGSVVGLPAGVIYRIENRDKEAARTLHFISPPSGLMPCSEGIKRLYQAGGLAVI
jgi:hypothetical protein